MSLPESFLEELRSRTSLSGLIGKSVRLQRAGNEHKACCPFHEEKTASFYVNDDKAFYHCFGCGAHGDAMRWLMEARGLEFLDAVRELADQAGLAMPERSSADRDRDQQQAGLHDVVGAAERWFREQLGGLAGSAARQYLEGRLISSQMAAEFGLGFAPDSRSALRRALAELGDRQLLEAGLLAEKEEGSDPYDRFRGRLIFPIHDHKARPIGFSGRIVGSGEPKYLNSPETPLFDKGRTLFNLHRAAPAARLAGRAIVVEGQMDVISLAQAGIGEVVAPLGTALTEAQLERLWRLVRQPILCFDGDSAGQRACAKAAIRALPGLGPERSLAFAILPSGQDPDDLVRAGGREAIEALLAQAIPLVELLWRFEHGAQPLATPEARAALRQRLVDHARQIGDRDLAREYENEFRRRVDSLFEKAKRPGRGQPARSPAPLQASPNPGASVHRKMIIAVLRGMARFPDVALDRAEQLAQLGPRDQSIDQAIGLLLDAAMGDRALEAQQIDELFPEERGWTGFRMSFLRADTWEPRAIADLAHMLDMLIATQDGLPTDQLARMARDYRPPEKPEGGKLV